METPFVLALAGLAAVAGFLGLFLYLGHRSSRDDLVAPPQFGQRPDKPKPVLTQPVERGPLPPYKPAQEPASQAVVANSPVKPKAKVPIASASAPDAPDPVWRREGPLGHANLSETCYSPAQLAEREIKALVLQKRYDRALRHATTALKLTPADAEALIARIAHGLRD